jgi:Predicted deacylase
MAIKNITTISNETKGEIERNIHLMKYIPESEVLGDLVHTARSGTPLLKIGRGFPKVMITAGIHGNELPPQAAAARIIADLSDQDINGTVYVIPFAVPHATMENSRRFKGVDMNRAASKGGFISNNILNTIKDLEISAVGDFHSTKPGSNPGVESVFCSKSPCYKSYLIAKYITESTYSRIICHQEAGALYNGALEDECNLEGVPAVTCEVVSQNGLVTNESHERSYMQMISYLQYFNII